MTVEQHDQKADRLDTLARTKSGSFIFHGPNALTLTKAALELARRLNCRGDDKGTCSACKQIAAGTYPDLIVVRPEGRPSITIEQMRAVISAQAYSLYHSTGRRVVIIDGAQTLSTEAQNALLKVLEEPPPATLFILATTQPASLLPTVRSRCAEIYFGSPADPASGPAAQLTTALGLTLFERLLLAKGLAEAKTDLAPAAAELHHAIADSTRAGTTDAPTAARRLSALELFRRQIDAKVVPRVALERLMLEL